MKLASRRAGRDGELLVVSSDLTRAVPAVGVAATLQQALDEWDAVAPALETLYADLNAGRTAGTPLDPDSLDAPLPRAWQWLDGSAFPQHGALMQRAYNHAPIETDHPLMYQGMSHRFLAASESVPFVDEAHGIDFEGEFAVITGDVPIDTPVAEAARHIRLAVQVNDWSLRALAGAEMKTGFGWVNAKPACSMAPIAITLDELGGCWRDNRIQATLEVRRNGERFGRVPATEMEYGFEELIAHAARTRDLCAGTVIGSGTVSHSTYATVGSCCISERHAIEMIAHGERRTRFLSFGERIAMEAWGERGAPMFGTIDQKVVEA